MTPDSVLDREMTYTDWQGSCKDLYALEGVTFDPIVCRRPHAHDAEHASGFGSRRRRW